MNLNQTFKTLLKEAAFTKEILGEGATQIRKANYAKKGMYFLSFTSLSTGLERIGKLCLMLDYYIDNNGAFPDPKYLKNNIGHNLEKLYTESKNIIKKRNINLNFLNNLDDKVHQNILKILSDFAKGERYSNINLLVGVTPNNDPIQNWYNEVDMPLFNERVSKSRKEKIKINSEIINELFSSVFHVQHISESGKELTQLDKASYETGFNNAVCKYRQLYIMQIIRYWSELLRELQYLAMELGTEDIPFFSEIFGMFCNSDSYLKTRKTWNTDF